MPKTALLRSPAEGCAIQLLLCEPLPPSVRAGLDAVPRNDLFYGEIWRAGIGIADADAASILDAGQVPGAIGPHPGLHAALAARHPRLGLFHLSAEPWPGETDAFERSVGAGYRRASPADVARLRAAPSFFPYWDHELEQRRAEGASWQRQCEGMVAVLPPVVYLSVDLSVLAPHLCPGRGAPMGGLEWWQLAVLLRVLSARREVAGFALEGLVDAEADGRVAAALLYQQAGCALGRRDAAKV